ncbi:dynein axonemal assembly factor 11 isoform X2 [Ischnura elegans]|uniref:dynein axonemal assembly factor 11 isoform X2 n=1 Tax=Ischnura elegans TaxID=197161 RepID=UPI001ED878BA|nr:dynein axonemal assembly factor 11 isoform X2 [Ischnura elegans]
MRSLSEGTSASQMAGQQLPHIRRIAHPFKVTIDLIRKRAEHNEGEVSTLEELALHQEEIEKIEHIQNWCKDLQILYLQNNLISKIENLGKLKKLLYLNLALNNIEKIENLQGCESLEKLDLTLNFIGDLRDVGALEKNYNLKHLFLLGNPCTDYEGYRDYVATILPNLKTLDGAEISRSERIVACQCFPYYKDQILQDYNEYRKKREREKEEAKKNEVPLPNLDNEEEIRGYWSRLTANTPETRVQLTKDAKMMKERYDKPKESAESKKPRRLFTEDGRPLNINEARIPFRLHEDDEGKNLILDITVYRYLDTSYLDVDVQPTYVKVMIKGKIFQIVHNNEICTEKSTAKRSTTTGHLVITMPLLKVNEALRGKHTNETEKASGTKEKVSPDPHCGHCKISRREILEIGPRDDMDFSRIVENHHKGKKGANKREPEKTIHSSRLLKEKVPSHDFIDNPDVPPLE